MAKKNVSEIKEFVNFIKNLYKDYIQLNFDSYFIFNYNGGDIELYFPHQKFYFLKGTIDLTDAPRFKEFLTRKPGSVKILNSDLNELRKCKVKQLSGLPCDYDDTYTFVYTDDNEKNHIINLVREDCIDSDLPTEFKHNIKIDPLSLKEELLLVICMQGEELTFEKTKNIVFDSPMKNFKMIFKKDAEYTFYSNDKVDGFRIVMIEGKSPLITMRQYFRVL